MVAVSYNLLAKVHLSQQDSLNNTVHSYGPETVIVVVSGWSIMNSNKWPEFLNNL